LKEGFGTYQWVDGKKYEGYWLKGKQHGEGKFTNGKGKSRMGLWEDGVKIRWIDNVTTSMSSAYKIGNS
jgi:hypothetical protein